MLDEEEGGRRDEEEGGTRGKRDEESEKMKKLIKNEKVIIGHAGPC